MVDAGAADTVVMMVSTSRLYVTLLDMICVTYVHTDLLDAPPHRYIRAPSPPPLPPFRSSSLGYMEPSIRRGEIEPSSITQHEAFDRYGWPTTVTRRRRSRSREVAEPTQQLPFLRPGDEVIEIQRHPAPTEDYDWYDRDGMRVRVREI